MQKSSLIGGLRGIRNKTYHEKSGDIDGGEITRARTLGRVRRLRKPRQSTSRFEKTKIAAWRNPLRTKRGMGGPFTRSAQQNKCLIPRRREKTVERMWFVEFMSVGVNH